MSNNDDDSEARTAARAIQFDGDLEHVQSLISSRLEKLSRSQIFKAYSDIHGTSDDIEGTSEMITTTLQQMEESIASIPKRQAYDRAKAMDPAYVESSQLRLRFLRGTGFKPKPAAEKLVRFFEIKLEFFGSRNLVKDIQQSDLKQKDRDYLYSGHIQWVPLKDNSGRLVTIMYPGPKERGVTLGSLLRVALYLRMVAIEDVQIQRKGFVFVLSAADIGRGLDLDLPKVKRYVERFIEIHNAMPGTLKALHIVCAENHRSFNQYIFAMMSQFMLLALRPSEVARVRIKKDCSQSEIQEYLIQFGIPEDQIPPSNDTTAYTALLTQRKELEQLRQSNQRIFRVNNSVESVCMPSPFDVISGRGRSLMGHHGNRILRNLVEEHMETYEAASRQHKKVVSSEVVDLIKKKGRFLREHLHGWVEIDTEAARMKVSHAFRDFRASSKKTFGKDTKEKDDVGYIIDHDGIGSFEFDSSDGEDDGGLFSI
ncbi:unnamed protein product [Cylindrotheca closterium]|uniref:DUF6824 domain-containing protein n=1 Tax=Cylindrotheca closterium TaxID=2856 RepID=A0AAD2G8D2_9STRA|nr:unnamed protein product [Cylindrotheca closterium]